MSRRRRKRDPGQRISVGLRAQTTGVDEIVPRAPPPPLLAELDFEAVGEEGEEISANLVGETGSREIPTLS